MNNLLILTIVIVGIILLVDPSHGDLEPEIHPSMPNYNKAFKAGFRHSVNGLRTFGNHGNRGGNEGGNRGGNQGGSQGGNQGGPQGGNQGGSGGNGAGGSGPSDLASAAKGMAQRIANMGMGGGK